MHVYQQIDEHVPYEDFALQLRELNDEQKNIVDDILYKKKNPTKPLHIVLTWGVGTWKIYILMSII